MNSEQIHEWLDAGTTPPTTHRQNGVPKRDTVINEDDILNLRIALNTAKDLDEFLAMV